MLNRTRLAGRRINAEQKLPGSKGGLTATAASFILCSSKWGRYWQLPISAATAAGYMLIRKDRQYWKCNCHCRQLQSYVPINAAATGSSTYQLPLPPATYWTGMTDSVGGVTGSTAANFSPFQITVYPLAFCCYFAQRCRICSFKCLPSPAPPPPHLKNHRCTSSCHMYTLGLNFLLPWHWLICYQLPTSPLLLWELLQYSN